VAPVSGAMVAGVRGTLAPQAPPSLANSRQLSRHWCQVLVSATGLWAALVLIPEGDRQADSSRSRNRFGARAPRPVRANFETDDREELLAGAEESIDRLTQPVASLLDVSRLQARALAVFRRPADLGEFVASALDGLGPQARRPLHNLLLPRRNWCSQGRRWFV